LIRRGLAVLACGPAVLVFDFRLKDASLLFNKQLGAPQRVEAARLSSGVGRNRKSKTPNQKSLNRWLRGLLNLATGSRFLLIYRSALAPKLIGLSLKFRWRLRGRRGGDNMTKAELVEDVARAAELTKKDAERLVEIVFESIIETLNHGEKIELRGFGSFRVRERGARRGRNPKTGDPVDIPAKRVPYFKPGKELKELINEEPDSDSAASSSENGAGAGGQNEGGGEGQTPPLM
jgi:integration host factor subunit beta